MPALFRRLADGLAVLGGGILFVIVAVTTTNTGAFILDRMLAADVSGLPGYEDFVQLAISAAALMFFPYCQAQRGHVAVDLFMKAFPPGFRRNADRLWLVLTAIIAVFLAYWMVQGLLQSRSDNVTTAVLGWPVWPFYMPGILSLGLWAAIALGQLGEDKEHHG